MDEPVLNAVPRTVTGSADCRRLRRDGLVPGVVYGHGEHQNITFDLHDFILLLHHMHSEHAVVSLELDGKKQNVLIKDVQRHAVTHAISHIDFMIVDLDETVRITIPVEIIGEADGVKNFSGVLELIQREVEIECKARDIPEAVVVDVSPLKVHDVIRIGELPAIDGVTFIGDPETTVITIAPPTVHAEVAPREEVEEAEEAAEPEVITARSTEETGEEG
jgi:large subunit ribosomal protein L25